MTFEIVHRDSDGKVLERRSQKRGRKTGLKGRVWKKPDAGPPKRGPSGPPGKGPSGPPVDRWITVGQERRHGLSNAAWKDERDVPDKEPRGNR